MDSFVADGAVVTSVAGVLMLLLAVVAGRQRQLVRIARSNGRRLASSVLWLSACIGALFGLAALAHACGRADRFLTDPPRTILTWPVDLFGPIRAPVMSLTAYGLLRLVRRTQQAWRPQR